MTAAEFSMLYPHSEIKFVGKYKSEDEALFESFDGEPKDEPQEAFSSILSKQKAEGFEDQSNIFVEAIVIWRPNAGGITQDKFNYE